MSSDGNSGLPEEGRSEGEQVIDLAEKFPDLRPIVSSPSLWTVNGCGMSMYGRRDFDEETGTYIKTHCLCAIFIPFFALRAYRVADARQGWYFIGREPLSRFAKTFNWAMLGCVVWLIGVGVWRSYTGSEEYQSAKKLQQADEHVAAGELVEAAQLYGDLIAEYSSKRGEALQRFEDLASGPLAEASPQDAAQVVQAAVDARIRSGAEVGGAALWPTCLALARKHAADDPRGVLALLDALAPVAPEDDAALEELRLELLEQQVAASPGDVPLLSQLAEVYERRGETDKCKQLLAPHADRLGFSEGARILGQTHADEGNLDEARRLLQPYVSSRLVQLKDAEQTLDQMIENSQEQAIEQLNNDSAFRRRYESASPAEQNDMVNRRVLEFINADRSVTQAQEKLAEARGVVPVALDLGVIMLRRAQAMQDPAAREAELKEAEKLFLEIQGQAGDSDAFQISLGQVYYWLGKHDEGRELFDQVLESQGRTPQILLAVSNMLREVGVTSEARALAEEAFAGAAAPEERNQAAMARSLLATDLEDRIHWLRQADASEPQVKAGLSDALGKQAREAGRDEEAVTHLRDAVAAYGALPESASTLNNAALSYMTIYAITGDREDFDRGVEMLERALALEPGDSILLINAASVVSAAALRDIVGDRIDLNAIKVLPGFEHLSYLYDDQAGREPVVQQVRSHAMLGKAVGYMDQVTLLSAKRPGGYQSLLSVHAYTRDAGRLKDLLNRLERVELDLADSRQMMLDHYAGTEDAKRLAELQAAIRRGEQTVEAIRPGGGTTFAVAAASLANRKLGLELLGAEVDAAEVLKLAEDAHAAAPSDATRWALINVLSYGAVRGLAAGDAAFDAMRQRARRGLSDAYLLAVAVSREGPQREAALARADVQRIFKLFAEDRARFPGDSSPLQWALLTGHDAEAAARHAELLAEDEAGRLRRAIQRRLQPLSATAVLDHYWELQAGGEQDAARAQLAAAAAEGVPVPFHP